MAFLPSILNHCNDSRQELQGRCYSLYVLFLLLLIYVFCLLDRFVLTVCAQFVAHEIGYGEKSCVVLRGVSEKILGEINCEDLSKSPATCNNQIGTDHKTHICEYDFNGSGFEYQLLVGPIFITGYALSAVPMGYLADMCNRKHLLIGSLMFWSTMTFMTGFATEYWHLALLRFGLGFGQASCVPLAISLLADYFAENIRGSVFGIYNCGYDIGYGLSYALGNVVTVADISGKGWRWAFFISAMPGFAVGALTLLTVREPEKMSSVSWEAHNFEHGRHNSQGFFQACRQLLSSSLVLIFIASSLKIGATYLWNCNTQLFYNEYFPDENIAAWVSWIPVVGCFGMWLGGFISDRLVQMQEPTARMWVVIYSSLLAAPFAAGTLLLNPPWTFISQIPCCILGNMWIPVTLAVVVELVPSAFRTTGVAFFILTTNVIGWNLPILVSPIHKNTSFRFALFLLYPGIHLVGASIYLVSLFMIRRDLEVIRQNDSDDEIGQLNSHNKDTEDTSLIKCASTDY